MRIAEFAAMKNFFGPSADILTCMCECTKSGFDASLWTKAMCKLHRLWVDKLTNARMILAVLPPL